MHRSDGLALTGGSPWWADSSRRWFGGDALRYGAAHAATNPVDCALRWPWRGRDDGSPAACVENLAHRDGRRSANPAMSKLDELVDRGADRLQELANRAAASGGAYEKLAEPLAEDAAFLRRLKPSLMAARARGEAPTDLRPAEPVVSPSGPQLGRRPEPGNPGPNPFVVVAAAVVIGILLAKLVDWRSHAHPRD